MKLKKIKFLSQSQIKFRIDRLGSNGVLGAPFAWKKTILYLGLFKISLFYK